MAIDGAEGNAEDPGLPVILELVPEETASYEALRRALCTPLGRQKLQRMLADCHDLPRLRGENAGLLAELEMQRADLEALRAAKSAFCEENRALAKELEQLRNECLDKEYENGFFVEDDVMRKIEEENCRLRTLVEDVYTDLAGVWFGMVNAKIREAEDGMH